MRKWKLGFEVLIICFLAVIWCALYLEKQNEQEDQYPDNSESSENDGEDRLIIVSTDDKSKEQEDEFLFPAESVKKIVLELSCEDHMTQENNAQQTYEEILVDGY